MKKYLLFTFAIFHFTSSIIAQPSSWQVKGIGGGGTFWRPSINPGNDNEYYVHTEMGSFFHTTNFGQTYTELSFLQLQASDKSVIRFTNNPNILYGLGISMIDRFSFTVYKSTNGGTTWNPLPCITNATQWQAKTTAVALYVDYNNPNHFAYATRDGMYFSGDGGTTMQDLTQTSPSYQFISGCFFEGNNIYMGTPGKVLISTNGGTTFSVAPLTGIPSTEDIIGFAAAKVGTTVRFFCNTIPTGIYATDDIFAMAGGVTSPYLTSVYRCDYSSSTTWVPKNNGLTVPTSSSCYPCDYIAWIGMAENDINTVYAGGVNGNSEPMVVKTIDGGNNWTEVFKITNNQNIFTGYMGYQGDPFQWYDGFSGMGVCATNANKVVLANMGCVMKSANGGTSWEQAYVNMGDENPMNAPTPKHKPYRGVGIENTTNWNVTWVDANNIAVSITDIGFIRSRDAGTHFAFNNFNYNTMYNVLKHPTTGNLYGATSNIHDMYASTTLQDQRIDNSSYSQGELMISTDTGFTWSTIHNFGRPVYWIAFDPNNSNKMYASVVNHAQAIGGIWVTSNLQNGPASTWTQLPAPPRTEGHPGRIQVLNDGKVVCTFGARMTDWSFTPPGKFTKSSGVFLYDPGTNSWSDRTDLNKMAWYANDIYVDPNDVTQNTWYAGVASGWGGVDATNTGNPNDQGALFKSTDRGITWTSLLSETNGLAPGGGVFSCTINPNNANQMFVTTTVDGLWMSNNINSPTPTFSQVSNFQFAVPLRVLFNPYNTNEMWVTTFGNGLHVGLNPTTGMNDGSTPLTMAFSMYPNPASETIYLTLNSTEKNILIFNAIGEEIKNIPCTSVNMEIKTNDLSNGIYFIKVGNTSKKLVVNH